MKNFLKTTVAAFVGVLLFSVVAGVITVIALIGMAASAMSPSTASIKDGSVLVINLNGELTERSTNPTIQDYMHGDTEGTIGLTDILSAIKKAKENDKIKGIYIESGTMGFYMTQMRAIRNALLDFKKTGKWIVAYGDEYGMANYYIATAADKVYLNPDGDVSWEGLYGAVMMQKGILAKIGIKAVPFKCGKYKSGTEVYTEDRLSAPARAQEERIMGVNWKVMCQDVSKSRGISIDSLNSYADRIVTMEDPKTLVERKMVDGLLYYDQIKDEIKKRLKLDDDDDIPQVTVADMNSAGNDNDGGDEIAVYYASGSIVSNPLEGKLMGGGECIVSKDMIDELNNLADDDGVKAVVLRINSPGGSAYASEQIWRAIEQLKKKKPVVVSMGSMAASGGYYISSGANYIFAEPQTETGSIGIYGIFPNATDLISNKLGLKFDEIKTNRNGAFMRTSSLRSTLAFLNQPLTAEQAARIQASIDRGYIEFKSRVSKGRHMSMDKVEEIAQGHVYTAADALGLKLVDKLGSLDDAVAKASQLAKVKKYHTGTYPEYDSILEQLMNEGISSDNYLDKRLRLVLGDLYEPIMMLKGVGEMDVLQARVPYCVSPMQ